MHEPSRSPAAGPLERRQDGRPIREGCSRLPRHLAVDADAAVDAQNAPTAAWKSRAERGISTSVHSPFRFVLELCRRTQKIISGDAATVQFLDRNASEMCQIIPDRDDRFQQIVKFTLVAKSCLEQLPCRIRRHQLPELTKIAVVQQVRRGWIDGASIHSQVLRAVLLDRDKSVFAKGCSDLPISSCAPLRVVFRAHNCSTVAVRLSAPAARRGALPDWHRPALRRSHLLRARAQGTPA